MTHRKIIAYTRLLFLVSILFWIAETAYFGWNAHAMSDAEKMCDKIVSYGIVASILIRIEVCCDWVIDNCLPPDNRK